MNAKWVGPARALLVILLACIFAYACRAEDAGQGPQANTEGSLPQRVQQKVRQVQERGPAWAAAGGDPNQLAPLAAQVDAHLKAYELPQAEEALDRILAVLNGPGAAAAPQAAAPDVAAPARVQRKVQEVQKTAPLWAAKGGDPNQLTPLAQQLDRFLAAGQLREAEDTLDKLLALIGAEGSVTSPPAVSAAQVPPSTPTAVKLGKIPPDARIVYHANSYIYVTDASGQSTTQITYENPRHWESVAVSYDRRRVVANEWARPAEGGRSSRLLLFDLDQGTEVQLVPSFKMAGNGGVEWSPDGFIYFAGVERDPRPDPRTREDFIANAGANDVYRVRYDGTGLQRLTDTPDRGEADVGVSHDGSLVAFMATKIQPPNDYTELWVANSDGTNRRLVYTGGQDRVASVHDPAFSPDNSKLVFSKVNPDFKNFPSDPNANTAHDIYSINLDGTGLTRITPPGPISILPDVRDDEILYLELNDQERPPYLGLSVIRPDGTGHRRVKPNANIGRWIP